MNLLFRLEDLEKTARKFWEELEGHRVFAFHGEMGAGKTTFISALLRARGVEGTPSSPTFSIINEHRSVADGKPVYHMDLYRLRDEAEVIGAGVEDTVYSGALCFVEWPEKAPQLFEDAVHVYLEAVDGNTRRLRVEAP